MHTIKKETSANTMCPLSQGITFIEVLLILMLLALFTAITARIYLDYVAHAPLNQTQRDILTIKNALMLYQLDNGFYPTTEQGLSALVTQPTSQPIPLHWTHYLKAIPLDQGGNPYHYTSPDKHHDMSVYGENSLRHLFDSW